MAGGHGTQSRGKITPTQSSQYSILVLYVKDYYKCLG